MAVTLALRGLTVDGRGGTGHHSKSNVEVSSNHQMDEDTQMSPTLMAGSQGVLCPLVWFVCRKELFVS